MNPMLAIVLALAFVIGVFTLMVMFKIKFAVNSWASIKKTFGKTYKMQASNLCTGSDFSSFTDNDKALLNYINGSNMCPKERAAAETKALNTCTTAQKFIPSEVIQVYPDDRVTSLGTNCAKPPGVPPTTNSDWTDDEFVAWKAALGKKCTSFTTGAPIYNKITAPEVYKFYSNNFLTTTQNPLTLCPSTA